MHDETITYLFDPNSQYVLFSGTGINGNGPFRHLNDLFFILYLLIKKKVNPQNIFLAIDKEVLKHLDQKTKGKKFTLLGEPKTFLEIIAETIPENNIIHVYDFETTFKRNESDLVFFASGHGSIQGLALDNGADTTFLSSDYFEDIANEQYRTILIMSQCQAAAFHHLDTRKNLCVLGASDYQSSISIFLDSMTKNTTIINEFGFEKSIAINPFIFTFFMTVLSHRQVLSKKKNLITLFKYVAVSTLDILNKTGHRELVIKKTDLANMGDEIKIEFDEKILVQQPFLLNKILAARVTFVTEES